MDFSANGMKSLCLGCSWDNDNDMSKITSLKINASTLYYGIPYPQAILNWLQ